MSKKEIFFGKIIFLILHCWGDFKFCKNLQNFQEKNPKFIILIAKIFGKFSHFLRKKIIFENEPWPDFKIKFFLYSCRWKFRILKYFLSTRNQKLKKNLWSFLSKFLQNFFFVFVEKIFSKTTFPSPRKPRRWDCDFQIEIALEKNFGELRVKKCLLLWRNESALCSAEN